MLTNPVIGAATGGRPANPSLTTNETTGGTGLASPNVRTFSGYPKTLVAGDLKQALLNVFTSADNGEKTVSEGTVRGIVNDYVQSRVNTQRQFGDSSSPKKANFNISSDIRLAIQHLRFTSQDGVFNRPATQADRIPVTQMYMDAIAALEKHHDVYSAHS